MYDCGYTGDQNQSIHIDANNKHFRDWSALCSLLATDTWHWCPLVRMTRGEKIKRDNTEKVWGAIFGSKMAFVWVAQPKWPHNSSTGIRRHVHNTTLPECKHWVGHPTHAECSHYNACPDHTPNCFYGGADLSSANIQLWLHSQVTDYTMESRLPCRSWGDSGQNSTAYVVYTWYINIFQRTIKWFAVYLAKTLYTSDWHTSIANLLKRIHKSSAETLVYFFHEAQEGMREQNESKH